MQDAERPQPGPPPGGPLLSVCIPTRHRPELLRRAFRSVATDEAAVGGDVELVVSDNSEDDASRRVVEDLSPGHAGPVRYHRNEPPTDMVGNFNRCIELARGAHVLILHDDDRLLPGGPAAIVEELRRDPADVMVFGVEVETPSGDVLRRQIPRSVEHLAPADIVRRLLTDSSYVRFPAMVVRRSAYAEVGGFDPGLGGACDLDMWLRLGGRYGATLVPRATAGYLVHPDADTESVFTPETIERAEAIFDRVRATRLLPDDEVRTRTAAWYHQFALAGAVRRLRARDRAGAAERLQLLDHPVVRRRGRSWRWQPLRLVLRGLTLGADPPAPDLSER